MTDEPDERRSHIRHFLGWHLRAVQRAGLGRWVHGWRLALTALSVFPVIVIVLLVQPQLSGRAMDAWAEIWRPFLWPENHIAITVQSPSVQTRERLINDRFEEVAWADMLLKSTMQGRPPGTASPDVPQPASPTGSVQVHTEGAASGAEQATEKPPAGEGKAAGSSALSASSQTRTAKMEHGGERRDWFERERGFRDLVRAERADAMLDDRHDMDGDTLYNLSFDTTVMPAPGLRAFAAIRILLTNDPSELGRDLPGKDLNKDVPGVRYARERFSALERRDVFEIYLDWQTRAQKVIDNSLVNLVTTLNVSLKDPEKLTAAQYLDFVLSLRIDLCEAMVQPADRANRDYRDQEDSQARDACRAVLTPRPARAGLPTELVLAAKGAKDKLSKFEELIREGFDHQYRVAFDQNKKKAVEPLQKHIADLNRLTEENSKISAANAKTPSMSQRSNAVNPTEAPGENGKIPRGSQLSPWDLARLQEFSEIPGSALPTYEAALAKCDQWIQKSNPAAIPRIPIPKLFDIYRDLNLLQVDSAGAPIPAVQSGPTGAAAPASQSDPVVAPAPALQSGRAGAAVPTPPTVPIFYLPCPRAYSSIDQLRTLEAILDARDQRVGDPDELEIPDIVPYNNAPEIAGSEDLQVALRFRQARKDKHQSLGRPSCIAARALQEQLRFGKPNVIPARGGPNYKDFFQLSLEPVAGGDCSLRLLPKVPTLTKDADAAEDHSPARVSGNINCKLADESARSIRVKNICPFAKACGNNYLNPELAPGGNPLAPGGFIPIQIGGTYYPVTNVERGEPVTLTIPRCPDGYDSKKETELFYDKREHVLGLLKIILEGPTYSGEKPYPTTEAFAYGLTPRLGRSFTFQGEAKSSVNANVLSRSIVAGSQSDVRSEIAEADVAGFNPHPKEWQTSGRAAEFGWIVAPQTSDTGASALQVEEMLLGALVAVPGWWRTVLLRICTAGVAKDQLPNVDDPNFWGERGHCRVETLRLPGTGAELSRRFGIEVLTTPFVQHQEQRFDLSAGSSARLLLQGGRLWRSTVVTLGGQRADQITVLPHERDRRRLQVRRGTEFGALTSPGWLLHCERAGAGMDERRCLVGWIR